MADLTIRGIPDEQIQTLKARAARAGQSLQEFMRDLIAREASRPTMAELTARLDREAIDEGRAGR
ncbi:FitA-like ribbon-helix-helix domain-containing protein [Kitasatospora sp. NPDC051170]|uniref:FitA-like ribbon-helix-helix domain-containing protein n=1 Tax=Kitasatospora sp. NPDC051170 TaxID=3364056 RepID=UPI0037A73B0D